MKYYIPTSTLNFNNILSSESISPKAFYENRGFGYQRWQSIDENNYENIILLYENPFKFDRPESEIEDHPMLIEVQLDEELPSLAEGVYYCDHTIYLSPWWTTFIFFSEQTKLTVLTMSESSYETKFMTLYRLRFDVRTNLLPREPIIGRNPVEIELNQEAIEKDWKLNKIKGFLYGYYIGALLSTKPENVAKFITLHELNNIIRAVVPAGELTQYQSSQIDKLLNALYNSNEWAKYLRSELKHPERMDEIVDELCLRGVTFPSMVNKSFIKESLTLSKGNDNNYAITWIEQEWEDFQKQIDHSRIFLRPKDRKIEIKDFLLETIQSSAELSTQDCNIVKSWVNNILNKKEFHKNPSSSKAKLSDELTTCASSVCGSNWTDSEIKSSLNGMRQYVRGGSIPALQWGNNIASYIAASIAKSDNWEELLRLMRLKSMCNYSLAFAFYGELIGFANLTRDFTDVLFGLEDKGYVTSVYEDIFKQLLGYAPYAYQTQPSNNEVRQHFPFDGQSLLLNEGRSDLQADTNKRKQKPSNVKGKGRKGHASSGDSNNVKQGSLSSAFDASGNFDIDHVDTILGEIKRKFPDLTEMQVGNIKIDLEWVLAPKYASDKSIKERIDEFEKQLKDGRDIPKTNKGKDLKRKNDLYRNLDIEGIIKCVKDKFGES